MNEDLWGIDRAAAGSQSGEAAAAAQKAHQKALRERDQAICHGMSLNVDKIMSGIDDATSYWIEGEGL